MLDQAAYADLKECLARSSLEELSSLWDGFASFEKVILFKLMKAKKALALFPRLGFKDRFLLLCAFPPESIAPVLERLAPGDRRLFHRLPGTAYHSMFSELTAARQAHST